MHDRKTIQNRTDELSCRGLVSFPSWCFFCVCVCVCTVWFILRRKLATCKHLHGRANCRAGDDAARKANKKVEEGGGIKFMIILNWTRLATLGHHNPDWFGLPCVEFSGSEEHPEGGKG